MWDYTGEDLGSLKNELLEFVQKRIKKLLKNGKIEESDSLRDELSQQMKIENNSLYFDKCITNAPKFYSLQKTLVNGTIIDISKLKGFTPSEHEKLNFDMLENATVENPITNKQKQFCAPRSGFVNEQDMWGIALIDRSKRFKVDYKKGNVDKDGMITPFIL